MADEPVFFLIAGEASGDLLGAHLMRALKKRLAGRVAFRGIGGPRMRAEGLDLFFPQDELAHFGVFELARHLPRLLRRIEDTAAEVRRVWPAALITIDSPDFCFRVARKVRQTCGKGVPLIHYVAPTVWAWRSGRAKAIARFLDGLMVLLPFEPPWFLREGLPCVFVGHPIVESAAARGNAARFREAHSIAPEATILTVLPGSRQSEVARLMPIFGRTVPLLQQRHRDMRVVIPAAASVADRVREQSRSWPVPVTVVEDDRDKYDAFAASRAALACSGTVALELALARVPTVIAYKVNGLTAAVYRRFIRAKYANLVNIMHNRMVVPELLQENCVPARLAETAGTLLSDEDARQAQLTALETVAAWLGQGQFIPSERAAATVLDMAGLDKIS